MKKKIRVIGDIHGDYEAYQQIISEVDKSIHVGDFGIGFRNDDFQRSEKHRFIRGNHDNPEKCKGNSHWIPDGTKFEDVFCVGGGFSIDRDWRTEGVDWWPKEELTYDEFYKIMDVYEAVKPKVVVSHEGPSELIERMYHDKTIFKPHSRTSQALQSMYHIHQPSIWIFGHWHHSRVLNMGDTTFICLGINAYIDIEY